MAGVLFIAVLLRDNKAIEQVSLPQEEAWRLPKEQQDNNQKYYTSLRKSQPWGKEEEEKQQTQAQVLQWRLVGIVQQSASKQVLIMAEGKLDTYQQGQSLPDGSVITAIDEDFMTIKKDQQQQHIDLYNKIIEKAQ